MKRFAIILLSGVMILSSCSRSATTLQNTSANNLTTSTEFVNTETEDTVTETEIDVKNEGETSETDSKADDIIAPDDSLEASQFDKIYTYLKMSVFDNNSTINDGYRVYAGLYVIHQLYDFEAEKMSVYEHIMPSETSKNVNFKSLPAVYYWIIYKNIPEEVFRAAAKAAEKTFFEEKECISVHEILSNEDIYTLYHESEDDIKRHFMLPFSYLDDEGNIWPATQMIYQIKYNEYKNKEKTPVPDSVIEEYRKKCLYDIVSAGYYSAVTELLSQNQHDLQLREFYDFIMSGKIDIKSYN